MSEPLVFTNLNAMSRRIHTRLADQIGLTIVRGDIAPGEALPAELRLCEMLNVSRTAVREALRVLVGKGLIQSRPKSGTKVRATEDWNHLDPDVLRWQLELADTDSYLRKLFELRFAVEPAASALAASAATADDAKRISAAFEKMAAANSNEAFVEADIEFHKSIYLATHNQFFWPIAQMFEMALRESFRIAAAGSHRHRAIAEHRELMQAICDNDPPRAHAAALKLLGNSTQDLVVIRGRDPFTGARPKTKKNGARRTTASRKADKHNGRKR
jgi:DNA-binding FadR family transcriptional regulator